MRTKKELPTIPPPFRCKNCNGWKIKRVKNLIANGAFQVWDRCENCGQNAWGKVYYVPHKQAGVTLDEIPLHTDFTVNNPPCAVCGSRAGVELHHFAPVHIFGREEAEKWPKEYLCNEHHNFWHQIIALHYQGDCLYCKGLATKGKELLAEASHE